MFGLQVSTWLKPNVTQRGSGIGTVHISKKRVTSILAAAGTPYSLEDMRKICIKAGNGATADFRSCFKTKHQETAIKLSRRSVPDDLLAAVDSCKRSLLKIHCCSLDLVV